MNINDIFLSILYYFILINIQYVYKKKMVSIFQYDICFSYTKFNILLVFDNMDLKIFIYIQWNG